MITEETNTEKTLDQTEGQLDQGDETKAVTPETPEVESGEVVVTIGEEDPVKSEEEKAPEWVRELRKTNREQAKKLKEAEAKIQTMTAEPKPEAMAKKPALEDFDFDSDRYDEALEGWFEHKRQADKQAAEARTAEEQRQNEWKARLDEYGTKKAELKVKDFEEAESEVQEHFSQVQQGIIVQGAENPALVVYAIGKNPEKGKSLAAIQDPVKFAFAVAKLEAQLKVTKKTIEPPERVLSGTGKTSGTVDSTLDRLRTEAEKSGDYTKVMQYKRQKQTNK